MHQTQATIERITRLSPTLSRIAAAADFAPGSLRPGQYLLARPRPGWEPYLRERWEPVRFEGNLLLIDRAAEAPLSPGAIIDILGPCGKAIPQRRGAERILLIVRGVAPSPLIALIQAAVDAKQSVTIVLDQAAQSYPLAELPPQVEVLRAPEAWGWTEQVDAIKWADQIIALSAASQALAHYGELWQSINQLRAPLPEDFALGYFGGPTLCGVGACGACLVRGRHGDIHACADGPALDLRRLAF